MCGFWTRRRVVVAVTLLVLAALIGGYAGFRSYVAENADAVTIVASGVQVTFLTTRDGTPIPERPVKPVTRLHYTGAQAREIQRAINAYSGPLWHAAYGCNPDSSEIYAYDYALTFTLKGIVVESAAGDSQSCLWKLGIVGLPSYVTDNYKVLPGQLNSLTRGQLPTPQAPDYA